MKKSIIITCAGMGKRLGMKIPKCLININGKYLIERNLEQLDNIDEIIVVVGYKKELVKDTISKINNKVKFVENKEYKNTSTGESFILGAKHAKNDYIIALDGDLLMHPLDLNNIIENINYEFIGGVIPTTENPVYIKTNKNNEAIQFNRTNGNYEWSGIAGIFKENIKEDKWYVFNVLEEILPTPVLPVRAREIDTPKDYEEAKRWINNNYDDNQIIDNFFKSRFYLKDNYVISRYRHNKRDIYDSELIKKYITPNCSLLDLGCGTGVMEELLYKEIKKIVAIDKYQEFINKAIKKDNIEYIIDDFSGLNFDEKFDIIILFGVTMYLSDNEFLNLLNKMYNLLKNDGTAIIKNQWGITEELEINKYSEDLKSIYYAKYRKLSAVRDIIESNGFSCKIHDMYPEDMNEHKNTHEYALILKKK